MRKDHILLAAALAVACDPGGEGNVNVTTYGEDYIEVKIPAAASADDEGFVDGFEVLYSKFLVAMSNIEVAAHDGDKGGEMTSQAIYDLHAPGPVPVTSFPALAARHWDEVAIQVRPANGAVAGSASAADVALMNDSGYSVYAEGSVVMGAETKTFRWGFNTGTRYHECETAEGSAGVVVPGGGEATVQFTVHGDHFFYDDLQSADTKLRATAMWAADANDDGEITLAELDAVDLTTLPSGQYGTGGDGTVETLGQFVAALSRTLIHYQGEGECHVTKL